MNPRVSTFATLREECARLLLVFTMHEVTEDASSGNRKVITACNKISDDFIKLSKPILHFVW
jgi:hypothetical protein